MKFLVGMMFFLSSNLAFCQYYNTKAKEKGTEKIHQNYIGAGFGSSGLGISHRFLNFSNEISGSDLKFRSSTVSSFSYQRYLRKNIFLGVNFSIQSLRGDLVGVELEINNVVEVKDIDYTLTRTHYSAEIGVSYVQTDDQKFELYGLARLGFLNWNINVNGINSEEFLGLNFIKNLSESVLFKTFSSRPTFGLVPIGARYFVTDNIGLNLDLSTGVPYLIRFQGTYKF